MIYCSTMIYRKHLISCYFPQLISWDKDNVIVTGSSDGIVRVRIYIYIVRMVSCNKFLA